MDEIEILDESWNFGQKFKFWTKIEILGENWNSGRKLKFWSKIEILNKNLNSGRKLKFCTKIEILDENGNSKLQFSSKLSIFYKTTTEYVVLLEMLMKKNFGEKKIFAEKKIWPGQLETWNRRILFLYQVFWVFENWGFWAIRRNYYYFIGIFNNLQNTVIWLLLICDQISDILREKSFTLADNKSIFDKMWKYRGRARSR